jgi:hypothetical protein
VNRFYSKPAAVKQKAAACHTGRPRIGVGYEVSAGEPRPTVAPGPYFTIRGKEMKEEKRRYVGIDLGKRSYTIAVIGNHGKVTTSNGKTDIESRLALYKKLEATDKVALEAGNMAFMMAQEMQERVGCEVVVLNSGKLALIYGSMKSKR